jgi:hypothetical protein
MGMTYYNIFSGEGVRICDSSFGVPISRNFIAQEHGEIRQKGIIDEVRAIRIRRFIPVTGCFAILHCINIIRDPRVKLGRDAPDQNESGVAPSKVRALGRPTIPQIEIIAIIVTMHFIEGFVVTVAVSSTKASVIRVVRGTRIGWNKV